MCSTVQGARDRFNPLVFSYPKTGGLNSVEPVNRYREMRNVGSEMTGESGVNLTGMGSADRDRRVDLGAGAYSVAEVCRLLGAGVTPRRVHYWLATNLLSPPLRWGARGHPTLLTYRQLLEIRTVQHLRDELEFSLPRVRDAVAWILETLFAEDWAGLTFKRGVDGSLVAESQDGYAVVPGGQGVLEGTIDDLNDRMSDMRRAWEEQAFPIPGHRYIVANVRILGGAATVVGTRVDTAVLARFAEGETFDRAVISEIRRAYPRLKSAAIADALEFEGLRRAA
jgi:uncharacterized protein (DUF433 family)